MNFINSLLQGAQLLMFNLNQRPANSQIGNMFQPSFQQSVQNESNTVEKEQIPKVESKIQPTIVRPKGFQEVVKQNQQPKPTITQNQESTTTVSNPYNFNQMPIDQKTASQMLLSQMQQQSFINSLLLNNNEEEPKEVNPEIEEDLDQEEELDDEQQISKKSKKLLRKRIKKINTCGHPDKEHYAKGMCTNCYHKYGRNKKPWKCQHEKLYACGLCQNCYINRYNQRKRVELGVDELSKVEVKEE